MAAFGNDAATFVPSFAAPIALPAAANGTTNCPMVETMVLTVVSGTSNGLGMSGNSAGMTLPPKFWSQKIAA